MFKIPFCHECKQHEGEVGYAELEACYNKLREIDDCFGNREIRLQLFGEKNADTYEYQPIVRAVVDLEDTENYFRPPYTQLKLQLAYNDDAPQSGGHGELLQGRLVAYHIHNEAPQGNQL